jgi:outer membrane murein-binding lipoprotein Lpp
MKSFTKMGIVTGLLLTFALVGGISAQAQSDEDSITEQLQEQVQQLQEQVAELQERLQSMRNDFTDDSDDADEDDDNDEAVFGERLRMGDRGNRVQRLQEFLAQDPDVYPEGLTTGYFGPLTSQAVARLQQQIGVPDDGELNRQTIRKIQTMINGAGNSGVTQPGLLRAPGIQRLFGDNLPSLDDDDDEDSDDNEDEEADDDSSRRGPDLNRLNIPEELKERLRAIFDRFKNDDDDGDDSDDDNELEIEVEFEDGEAKVEIEFPDGSEEEFTLALTDKNDAVDEIVSRTDLTKEEIEAVIKFDDDDDEEDEEDEDDTESDDDDNE